MERLFLSHSQIDQKLAGALKQLIESCLAGQIQVKASSASPSDGGIPPGSDWLEWVHEQVSQSRFTVVVLTPNSADKPWLMWEAGAVSGVSLATRERTTIIPLVYRLSMEQVPSPLRSRQAAHGEDRESVEGVLDTLRSVTSLAETTFNTYKAVFVPQYLTDVAQALVDTPPTLTESAVHDWLDRIDVFERTSRRSEIGQLHRALVNVFAPGDNAYETPLDGRLHRRLGDIYYASKRPQQAAQQYKLALRLSPRDILLMHKVGLAVLETGNEPGATEILERLLEIDPAAATWSTEIAGFKGRLHWEAYRRTGIDVELRKARDAYAAALESNADSHYMADNVGQLSLLLGDAATAKHAFEQGLASLKRTGDRSYWALAAKASCHLGLNEREEGLAALRQVAALAPEPAVIASIRGGLVRLQQGIGASEEDLKQWLAALGVAAP